MKSEYWLKANSDAVRIDNLSLQDQRQLALKRRVWKLATVPKIRMFLWRALSGAFAVENMLQSRGLNILDGCQRCLLESESINHMLFHCGMSQ